MVLPQRVAKFRATFLATLEVEQPKVTTLSQERFLQLYDECGVREKRLAYYHEGSVLDVGMAKYLKDFTISKTTTYERHKIEYLHI